EGCPIVSPSTRGIPQHALLVCEPFSARLGARAVAVALAAGLREAGRPEPDEIVLPAPTDDRETAALLEHERFHERMRAARAVVLAVPALSERTLAGSAAFEIATLARQSGVPCYAVAASVELDSFDLRILDLQKVVKARGPAALRRAGQELARVI